MNIPMPLSIKYYIATKEDKIGTVYSVAEYTNNVMFDIHTGKIESNGIQALKDITKWLIEKDASHNNYEFHRHLSFKFKNVDDAVHIGNYLDKELLNEYKGKNYSFFSSPAVFEEDTNKMSKANESLNSYLTLRAYYIKTGKIH